MSAAVANFSLGPHGHYWFQYKGENGQVVTETPQNLWPYLHYNPYSGLEITAIRPSKDILGHPRLGGKRTILPKHILQ
ncbi:hypothetical protein L873DRAFT_1917559 [Choiromyces venosus 120613-1]|uniref:Uncharacterized protein n=1 Tax=Choiromyces venosus 120613-1 TaxID=1336337 RepID=A0A3N4JHI3_9PEZI|nr:hypothetical protein L873DRAFT_1917559 [Choiromyces venosus 120613-1]